MVEATEAEVDAAPLAMVEEVIDLATEPVAREEVFAEEAGLPTEVAVSGVRGLPPCFGGADDGNGGAGVP